MSNVIELRNKMTGQVTDYIKDYQATLEMAGRIEKYHHDRGRKWVKTYIESELQPSGRRFHYIRSNIKFIVPSQ